MPSIVPYFEYDIYISYRHNDNRSGWVTEFVNALQEELAATIKEPLTIYFDKNPHDGLLETHNVDKSLEAKLKCLIFIPIISQTYCDNKSFAWQHEFVAFNKLAKEDQFGRDIKLGNGNVASRILPVKIHDLDLEDKTTIENELRGVLRAIEFIYKEMGVNRPLIPTDNRNDNQNKSDYRNQVNKVANAIKEILDGLKRHDTIKSPIDRDTLMKKKPGFIPLKIVIPVIIFLLIIVAYFSVSKIFQNTKSKRVSIAIIPFHNQTKDIGLDSYGFGIASEIRTQLALSGQFEFITSDQGTIKYRNSDLSPKEIATELDVDYLLFGNIYQIGDQLKIAAELTDDITNKSLWSLPINLTSVESVKQLFDIQKMISEKVMAWFSFAGKVDSSLPTNNLAAYQYFLEAKENWQKNLPIAEEQFAKAIQLDSNFVSAYVGLLQVKDNKLWSDGNDKVIREKDLKSLLNRIVELSPDSWETYLAKGIYSYHGLKNYEQGLEFLMKSISINPEGEEAISYAGALHRRRLNHEAAWRLSVKSIEINPQLASNWNELALVFKDNGNHKDAMQSELKAKRFGLERRSNYSLIAYFALEDSVLFQIPNDIREFYDLHFWRNLAKEQRDWEKLIAITDTAKVRSGYSNFNKNMDRAFAYYFMDNFESAKTFAALAQKEMGKRNFFTNEFYPEDIHFLMRDKDNGLRLMNERIENGLIINSHNGQDIQEMCNLEIDRIVLLAFAEEYDAATKSLIELNKRYPGWGNYRILYTDFRMDKIRKTYPPFNKALQNLKLPLKLEFPEKFKSM